ncbi:MAG: hypothetical protein K1X64_12335 [Myxococcaceae bacterium]|nr:hypothetical protein [Myxococcaceae bacterium]
MHTTFNRSFIVLLSALGAFGCSHVQSREMSAAEHRQQAALHASAAERERSQFDPTATGVVPSPPPTFDDTGDWSWSYNPTSHHLAQADEEMRQAAAHLSAAKELERFEDKACAGVSIEQRASCPLLASWVSRVDENKKGLVLHLKPGISSDSTAKVLNCHLAYAYAQGFDRPSCPLFVRGLTIGSKPPNQVEFVGQTAEAVRALNQQARRVFLSTQRAPTSQR